MKNCINCNHNIRKVNGQDRYEHTISPTGRSNGVITHFTDIGCRCDNPVSDDICANCGYEKIGHIDYFDTGKKNVCPFRKSMKYRKPSKGVEK